MFVSVAIELALDRLFTYEVPVELFERLRVGQQLRIPFHGRIARGYALSLTEERPAFATKPVMAIEDESPFFSTPLQQLVRWIATYTASRIGSTLIIFWYNEAVAFAQKVAPGLQIMVKCWHVQNPAFVFRRHRRVVGGGVSAA